jgi:hypothetical protein
MHRFILVSKGKTECIFYDRVQRMKIVVSSKRETYYLSRVMSEHEKNIVLSCNYIRR